MDDDVAERTDRVWHRALAMEPASDLPGDVAAFRALEMHGMVMNGGVLHGVDRSAEYVGAAAAAYRWFGLQDVADLLLEAHRAWAQSRAGTAALAADFEVVSDERYERSIEQDSDLEAAFASRVRTSPGAFS